LNLEPAYTLAYRLFGGPSERLANKFAGFSELIRRAYLGVAPSGYISLLLLVGTISSVVAVSTSFVALWLFLHFPLALSAFFSLLAFTGAWLITLGSFYAYPVLKARRMKVEVERDLAFIASYMAVMASAGVNPYEIFKSLARGDLVPSITPIAATIVRDVELLGFDALSAIMRAAKLSPSPRLRVFLDGIVATIHTGGDLASYLHGAMEEALRTERVRLRELAETLSVFGEAFVALFVAGPIFITIMLTLMAILGGTGGMDPMSILMLLIYVLMPLGGVAMLVIAKALTPGE